MLQIIHNQLLLGICEGYLLIDDKFIWYPRQNWEKSSHYTFIIIIIIIIIIILK